MTSQVETVTGPVPADQLGTTLIHEHLIVSDPELDRNLPHPEWDEDRATAAYPQRETGVPITTHSDPKSTGGMVQQLENRLLVDNPRRLLTGCGDHD